MKIIRGLTQLPIEAQRAVLTLGNFDGLHLGHQKILGLVTARAKELGTRNIVFTFEPHPLRILSPDRCPPLLTTFHERMELFEELGVDIVICAHFTEEFANQHPEDFIKSILFENLKVREIFVGYDYSFGKGKQGGTVTLAEVSHKYGFRLQVIEEVMIGQERVSSTAIRDFIRQGKMEKANQFLGRPYLLSGKVVHGCGRGKSLGFPTANLQAGVKLMPRFGVYLAQVHIQGMIYHGLAHIGQKPTFKIDQFELPGIEVYIFNFEADIYQQFLQIKLFKRLRDEIPFPNEGRLVEQINQDIVEAKQILEHVDKQA